jgi:hypothetical protein
VPNPRKSDNNKWDRILLSELLDGLRQKADEPKVEDEVEYAGNKKAFEKARKQRASLMKLHDSVTSAAGSFIKGAASRIRALIAGGSLISSGGRAVKTPGVKRFLSQAGRVEGSLIRGEEQLRLLLPDPLSSDERRWPGPISYRSALNHFVAVCIRVHSIAPEAKFEEVMFHVAKRVLIPAAAHNMKFSAKEYPSVYRAFIHDDAISLRIGAKLTNNDKTNAIEDLPGKERYFYRKWARLFNVMADSANFMSPERKGELFRFFQTLLRDYEAEPRTSQLWQDLSIIASGDMAVDEIVVSQVLDDVGMGNRDLRSSPLINCARARFGLLRYAYDMQHEAAEFKVRFSYAEGEIESVMMQIVKMPNGERLSDELVKKIFGWAYILSRYLLLGRQVDGANANRVAESHQDAARMLCELMDAVIRKDAKENSAERLLALRYMIGFLTNPRFRKSFDKIRSKIRPGVYCSDAVEEYIRLAEKEEPNGMPKSIVSMARARVVLHLAIAKELDKPGRSRDLQSALGHYAQILELLASPRDVGVMDGEVIAWVLPEIYYAVGKLSKSSPGDEGHWESVQKAILVLGEVQYGVYYNPQEELKRIEEGIQLAIA